LELDGESAITSRKRRNRDSSFDLGHSTVGTFVRKQLVMCLSSAGVITVKHSGRKPIKSITTIQG